PTHVPELVVQRSRRERLARTMWAEGHRPRFWIGGREKTTAQVPRSLSLRSAAERPSAPEVPIPTVVLGINAYHSSASAALLVDGALTAAVEEERFSRIKYDTGFPACSIRYCLDAAGLSPHDVDHVAIAGKPTANLLRKVRFALGTPAGRALVRKRGEPVAQLRIK